MAEKYSVANLEKAMNPVSPSREILIDNIDDSRVYRVVSSGADDNGHFRIKVSKHSEEDIYEFSDFLKKFNPEKELNQDNTRMHSDGIR